MSKVLKMVGHVSLSVMRYAIWGMLVLLIMVDSFSDGFIERNVVVMSRKASGEEFRASIQIMFYIE